MNRSLLRLSTIGATLAVLALAACFGGSTTTGDGTGGDGSGPGGGGVGFACSGDSPCRAGLVCTSGLCELGHAAPVGTACSASGECATGTYCDFVTRTCQNRVVPDGGGDDGASCKSDGECKDGLRCNLVGFSAQCQAEGKGDLGGSCKTSAECFGGLGCVGGKCASTQPGVPPFGISAWPGETCGEDAPNPIAYFRVPRGSGDGDFYRLPFPNDARRKNGKPDLSGHPTPGPELLGFDPVDRYLRAVETMDGFGAYSTTLLRFSAAPDVDSLRTPGAVDIIDLTEGVAMGGWGFNIQYGRGKYICKNWLGVRRGTGAPLVAGRTYATIVTKAARTKDGAAFASDADFEALVADTPPADAALTNAHAAYAPLRAYLKKEGKQGTLLVAAVFTVGSITAPAQKLAKATEAAPAPTATGWVKCGAGASPCPDTSGNRACGAGDDAFDEYHALVTLPVYQAGKAPYLNPEDGGNIDVSGDVATKVRDEAVCLSLTVPKTPKPAGGWPVVVYAHGTGGSFRSHVNEGVAKSLATATTPMAVLGIDQVQHGPRRGGSTQSPNNLFFNFANPSAAMGNPLQGAADQMALARFAASATIPLEGGDAAFDKKAILFWGHSQGATEGGIAVPYTPLFAGAVFSGQGGSLTNALLSKQSPVNIAGALPFALMDADTKGQLFGADFHPVLSVLQSYIDPADPLNHGAAIADKPPMGIAPHHVFQVYGLADTFSPPITEEMYATAAGLAYVDSPAAGGDKATFGAEKPTPAPVKENKTVGDKKVTAAVRKYAPPAGKDGHFVAFDDATAKADVVRFLSALAAGTAPQVGP